MLRIVKRLSVSILLALVPLTAAGSDDADLDQTGPLLLPLNPPYLNQAAAEEAGQPMEEPAAVEMQVETQEDSAEAVPEEETPQETPAEETAETTPLDEPTLAEPEPKKELTPAMVGLRDRVHRTLALYRRQTPSTRTSTVTEVMFYCTAFGCNTEVFQSGSPSKKINGITCLCWNFPCAGYQPLGLSKGRIAAKIGYGMQQHRGQLLAVLALSRVPNTYPVRAGENVSTVADLVEYEKLSCRSGTDLSLKLIGLSYYLTDDPTWENELGEEWSLQRIVKEELDQPIDNSTAEGMRRLTGIGCAVYRRAKRQQPMEGEFARAQKFISEYYDYALAFQNANGGWGPRYLASRQIGRDTATQLRTSGHVLQWLVLSLPEDRLEDIRVARAVERVNSLLASHRNRGKISSLRTEEIGSITRALHALVAYDERFFMQRVVSQPPAAQQASRGRSVQSR